MGILPIRERYARQWAAMSFIERINISIMGWNKTIVGSNNGTIPCAALERSKQQHVFVAPLTNYGTISVSATRREDGSHSQNNDRLFANDLLSCRHAYKQPRSETGEEMDVQDSPGGLLCSQF